MTKRERVLIFIMLILLILVGGYRFVVEPQIDRNTQLSNQLMQAQLNYNQTRTDMQSITTLQQTYEETQATLEELKANIDPYRQDEAIDRMLVAEAEAVGLQITALSISSFEDQSATDSQEAQLASPQITAKAFTLVTTGGIDSTIALVDSLQGRKDLLITHFSQVTTAADVTTITIEGLVYMDVESAE